MDDITPEEKREAFDRLMKKLDELEKRGQLAELFGNYIDEWMEKNHMASIEDCVIGDRVVPDSQLLDFRGFVNCLSRYRSFGEASADSLRIVMRKLHEQEK